MLTPPGSPPRTRLARLDKYAAPMALIILAAALVCSCSSSAQSVPQPSTPAPVVEGQLATPDQLDQLLAPIALYPDPLLSVLLPASTMPFDLVLAARYVRGGGDPAGIEAQPWDPSVKALAHYPDVLKWMDDNLEWTRAVGDAFRTQQEDVMASIQQLRSRARAVGNLSTTPEQVVIVDGGYIRVVPARTDVIYVPMYDPDVIYYERYGGYSGPLIGFSIGWAVGPWLIYDCDWQYHRLWIRDWRPGWTYRTGWQRPWRWDWDHHDGRDHREWHDPHRWDRDIPQPHVIPGTPPAPKPPHNTRGEGTRGGAIVNPPPRRDATGWGGTPTRSTAPTNVQSAPAAPTSSGPSTRGQTLPEAPTRTAPTTPPQSAPSGPSRTPVAVPVPVEPKRGNVFGGYQRGTEARDASSRGATSRQAPVAPPVRTQSPPQSAPRNVAPPQRNAPPPQRSNEPAPSGKRPR